MSLPGRSCVAPLRCGKLPALGLRPSGQTRLAAARPPGQHRPPGARSALPHTIVAMGGANREDGERNRWNTSSSRLRQVVLRVGRHIDRPVHVPLGQLGRWPGAWPLHVGVMTVGTGGQQPGGLDLAGQVPLKAPALLTGRAGAFVRRDRSRARAARDAEVISCP